MEHTAAVTGSGRSWTFASTTERICPTYADGLWSDMVVQIARLLKRFKYLMTTDRGFVLYRSLLAPPMRHP